MNSSALPVKGGAHLSTGMQIDTDWHYHDMHQLLYAFDGSVEIEDERARCLVPHQFAAWIPAGTHHRTRLQRVGSGSVFLDTTLLPGYASNVSIIRTAPLLREMIKEAMRWPIMERIYDPIADSFFQTFALLCKEWIDDDQSLVLPTTSDSRLIKAIVFTQDHLADATLCEVCKSTGMSQRTLRRRFQSILGMSWEDYRLRLRVFKALDLLEQDKFPIIEIAAVVGYSSPSAFAKAFRSVMRESPSDYRQRRITSNSP